MTSKRLELKTCRAVISGLVPSTSRASQQVGCQFDFDPKRAFLSPSPPAENFHRSPRRARKAFALARRLNVESVITAL